MLLNYLSRFIFLAFAAFSLLNLLKKQQQQQLTETQENNETKISFLRTEKHESKLSVKQRNKILFSSEINPYLYFRKTNRWKIQCYQCILSLSSLLQKNGYFDQPLFQLVWKDSRRKSEFIGGEQLCKFFFLDLR